MVRRSGFNVRGDFSSWYDWIIQSCWGICFYVAMFPTIYGIALKGVGEDAKFGAAGLIMAILGGSVLPPIQAAIFDLGRTRL